MWTWEVVAEQTLVQNWPNTWKGSGGMCQKRVLEMTLFCVWQREFCYLRCLLETEAWRVLSAQLWAPGKDVLSTLAHVSQTHSSLRTTGIDGQSLSLSTRGGQMEKLFNPKEKKMLFRWISRWNWSPFPWEHDLVILSFMPQSKNRL